MKYLYIIIGAISIFIITIFTFKDDVIYYNYAKYKLKNEDSYLEPKYFYEDNFGYINDYTEMEINNKNELYETIYYVINSGATNVKRYFNIDYENFEEDYNQIFSDENKIKLSTINNFVHPYNTFDAINVSLKGYLLEISIEYKDSYPDSKKDLINKKVDELINELIDEDMTDEEKIKVIHDYIINTTIYDKLFCIEENPEDCETTSPYQSDTAYGVLFENWGICSGYTDLMAIFLDKLEIPNYRVTNDSHTWNAVKVEDRWYHLDITWDDPISENDILSHSYFLITTEEDSELETSHQFDENIFIELK